MKTLTNNKCKHAPSAHANLNKNSKNSFPKQPDIFPGYCLRTKFPLHRFAKPVPYPFVIPSQDSLTTDNTIGYRHRLLRTRTTIRDG